MRLCLFLWLLAGAVTAMAANHRVQYFETDGTYVGKYGRYFGYEGGGGYNPMNLFYPTQATTDAAGNVYVCDGPNNFTDPLYPGPPTVYGGHGRILVTDPAGNFVRHIQYGGSGAPSYWPAMSQPSDCIVSGNTLYVLAASLAAHGQFGGMVFTFSLEGVFQSCFWLPTGDFPTPRHYAGIAVWGTDIVIGCAKYSYLVGTFKYYTANLFYYDKSTDYSGFPEANPDHTQDLGSIGGAGYRDIYDVHIGQDNKAYVASTVRQPSGFQRQYISVVTTPITGGATHYGPYTYTPVQITDDAGQVYVCDRDGPLVRAYNRAMVQQSSWGVVGTGNGEFGTIHGLAWNPVNSRLYVVDWNTLAQGDLDTDIDGLFGFQHVAYGTSDEGLDHALSPIGAAMETASAIVAAGVKPGIRVLPDGRLHAVYEDSGGGESELFSRDLGATWGVS